MENKKTYSVDYDVTDLLPKVRAISERFNDEIVSFKNALQELTDEGDPEAMTIFLEIHEGLIIQFGMKIEKETQWIDGHPEVSA